MVTIIAALIAGVFAVLAALITISKHFSNHIHEFNEALIKYESNIYKNNTMREVCRDRAAESLLNLKGVKAKTVDCLFYDMDMELKVRLIMRMPEYLIIDNDFHQVKVKTLRLYGFSFVYIFCYILSISYVSYQFINFNNTKSKFIQLFESGRLLDIFNWVIWDGLIFAVGIISLFMVVKIQEIRIFHKSKLYNLFQNSHH